MKNVIPAEAGIQHFRVKTVDPRLRWDDVSSVLLYSEQKLNSGNDQYCLK